MGYKDEAPYNAIHVGAAAAEIPQEVKLRKILLHLLLFTFRCSNCKIEV